VMGLRVQKHGLNPKAFRTPRVSTAPG